MTLYWGNNNNPQKTKIGEFNNEQEMNRAMSNHLKLLNFKSYYQRSTAPAEKGAPVCIDYGSYTFFFYVYDYPDSYLERFKNGTR